MRLMTHNTLTNNSADAKGKGFPLRITASVVKVDENVAESEERQISFVKGILPTLEWDALVHVRMKSALFEILGDGSYSVHCSRVCSPEFLLSVSFLHTFSP